jgi:hypothetical protein
MESSLHYFQGERDESYLFLMLGCIGLAVTLYIFFTQGSLFWKGFAVPLMLVSILEVSVAVTLLFRTPKDIARVSHFIEKDPAQIAMQEIPRMEKVMFQFKVFRYVEISFILLGVCLYLAVNQQIFWKGLALSLIMQSVIVLTLDYFAEERGKIYLEYLITVQHA